MCAHQPVHPLDGGEARIDGVAAVGCDLDEGAEEWPAAPKHP
jgi:hypothetical protein